MSSQLALLRQIFGRFSRVCNVHFSLNEARTVAEVRVPGFTYDDFDRAGNLSLHKLFRFTELDRMTLVKLPEDFLGGSDDFRNNLVLKCQELRTSRDLYERAALDFPMRMRLSMAHIGKTSFVSQAEVLDDVTNTTMATIQRLQVSRIPSGGGTNAVPENFRDKFGPTAKGPVFPTLNPFLPPKQTFSITHQVMPSDMDFLFHTNQASYVRYCMDTATMASLGGFFKSFKGDLCQKQASEFSVLYTGETFAGDSLTVHTWEEENTPGKLRFVVMNEDKPITFAQVAFYES